MELIAIAAGVLLILVLLRVLFDRLFARVTVFEYQRALRFTHGKLNGQLEPGSHWIYRPRTTIQTLEARPRVLTIPGQELLTADGVTLKVSLLLHICLVDAELAALGSASYEETLYARAQAVLREAVGGQDIESLLASRAQLSDKLGEQVAPAAQELGLELRSLVIKDIMFPGPLKEAFSQTARARQEAQATLERARGETAALRNLANSSRLFDKHPHLFQLRLLQAASSSGKVVVQVSQSQDPSGDNQPPGNEVAGEE